MILNSFCTQSALNPESKRPQTHCLCGFVVSILSRGNPLHPLFHQKRQFLLSSLLLFYLSFFLLFFGMHPLLISLNFGSGRSKVQQIWASVRLTSNKKDPKTRLVPHLKVVFYLGRVGSSGIFSFALFRIKGCALGHINLLKLSAYNHFTDTFVSVLCF